MEKCITISCLFILFISWHSHGQYVESDWEERDKWMGTEKLLDLIGVEEGHTVADIGAHEGYLSMHLAQRVGENGQVYSVDLRESRLERLEENARRRSLSNITAVLGQHDDPKIPEEALDIVILMDTYHEIRGYQEYLQLLRKKIKPAGRIAIIEKLKSHAIGKSREEQMKAHTLAPHFVKQDLEENGFEVLLQKENLGNWENNEEKKIWILVGRPAGS